MELVKIESVRTHICGLRHPTAIYDSDFFPSSDLCLVVYMYPTPICDIRRLICDSDFSALRPKKSDDK